MPLNGIRSPNYSIPKPSHNTDHAIPVLEVYQTGYLIFVRKNSWRLRHGNAISSSLAWPKSFSSAKFDVLMVLTMTVTIQGVSRL